MPTDEVEMSESPAGTAAGANAPSIPYAVPSTPRVGDQGASGVTRLDVATLALKLIGIYMIVGGLPHLISLGGLVLAPSTFSGSSLIYYLVMMAIYFGIGILLVVHGQKLGAKLLAKHDPVPAAPVLPMSPRDLQAAVFAIVGIILVVTMALPGLVYDLWQWQFGSRPSSSQERLDELKPFLVNHLLELGLGLWLFYGSHRLANYWERLSGRTREINSDEGPL